MSVNILLGNKREMSQIFKEDGEVIPVTILEVGPCTIAQVKNEETDGYNAVQLGFGEIKQKRVSKPVQGHWKKAGAEPHRRIRESRVEGDAEFKAGDLIKVGDVFAEGEYVDVSGKTKGRGFQGGIKRHGFNSGPRSHGTKNTREMGSTGAATTMARVVKGTRMPGQMGAKKVTVRNLEIARIDAARNLLYVRGAVPGFNGAEVTVRKAKAKRAKKEDRALRKGK